MIKLDLNLFHKLLVIIYERLKLSCAHFTLKVKMFIRKQKKGLAASVCVKCVLG